MDYLDSASFLLFLVKERRVHEEVNPSLGMENLVKKNTGCLS
jgi:hypothetical protein